MYGRQRPIGANCCSILFGWALSCRSLQVTRVALHDMDFTSTYSYASWNSLAFSPGSTFLAYVDSSTRKSVTVRVVGTLQVVRSWELDEPLDSLEWSLDGLYLLVNAYSTFQGVSYVLPLDPDATVTDNSDDGRGWIARIEAAQGLVHATWLPIRRIPAIVQFFPFHTAIIYSLADQSCTMLPSTALNRVCALPSEHFGVVQREKECDQVCLYTPHTSDAPSLEQPVQWQLYRAVPTNMSHTSGIAWSPDGQFVAVWDHILEYKLSVYTAHGTPQVVLTIQDDDVPSTHVPISAAECRSALTPQETGRARRVSLRASRTPSRRLSNGTTRRLSHVLGVRIVAWHPSSEFLAVGGYDDHVHVLSLSDWSLSYSLDVSVTALSCMESLPHIWVEPYRWFDATGGRGIVPMEVSTAADVPTLLNTQTLQTGTNWIAWNNDGSVLACRNEGMPTAVLLYEFFGLHERSVDAHLRLLGIIVLSSPVRDVVWRPEHACSLVLVTGQSSVYCWSMNDTQCCEAVAIPNDKFQASHITCSPDGKTLLLADTHSFCCVVTATEDAGPSGEAAS